MSEHLHWRLKAQRALEVYFERRSRPRALLTIVLSATGLVGLLASMGLYHAGVERMWLRYPAAVLVGYGAFLLLLRAWAEWEHTHFEAEEISGELPPVPGGVSPAARQTGSRQRTPGKARNHDWLDRVPDVVEVDFGEGCFVVILIAALIGVIVTLVLSIFAAPALIAEVFLDAFLITFIYQRLRVKADAHWLRTAIRRTWKSALVIAILMSIAGACVARLAPNCTSLGHAIKYWMED